MLPATVRARVESLRDLVARVLAENPRTDVAATLPLVLGIIARESGGDVNVGRGDNGTAVGLMQVRPGALADYSLGTGDRPSHASLQTPEIGVRVGSWYFLEKVREMGNVFDGLRAYNAGFKGALRNPSLSREYAEWVQSAAIEFQTPAV